MKRLGEYRSYLLYEVEEQDGRDINTSSGSRYIRNSILIFEPDENNPKLGDEWRELEKQLPFRKAKYARLHEGELAAFDHAAAQLEKLGVNTNVDPEKVLTLVKEQDGKVSELSAALKETTAKIDALRQAQRIVKEIYQQPKEPQEKRKERENQEL